MLRLNLTNNVLAPFEQVLLKNVMENKATFGR